MRFFVYVTIIAALLVSFVPAQAMLAATVVEPANPNGWMVVDDNGTGGGMGDFVSGPATPPLGTGSAHLTVNNSTAGWIFTSAMQPGTKLTDLSKLEYSTFVTANNSVQTIALSINVDYNVTDSDDAWQGRLNYEPYMTQNDAVTKGIWQSWNPILPETKWWATGGPGKIACPQSAPCTWEKITTDFPNAGFHKLYGAVSFKAGSGWTTFDGNFDNFVIGVNGTDQVYDFEPSAAAKASTVYVDDDFYNKVTLLPLPLFADPDGDGPAKSMGYDASRTVQGGVNIVASGGTVNVAAGTYTEQVLVNNMDGLTIEGAGEALVTIKAIPNLVSILGTDRKPVLAVSDSDNVTVKNLTLDGDGTGNTNNRLFGLFYLNSSGLIDHVTAKAMRHTPLNGVQGGVGIYVYNTDSVARTVTATNNTAIDYQKGGLVFNGVGLTAVVDKNTATSIGATPITAMNGIQIGYGANATVTRNTVSGHSYINPPNPTTVWTAAGILLYDATAEVSSNILTGNQVGISTDSSDFTAERNYITGGEFGLDIYNGTADIFANNITSNDYGVQVSTYGVDGTVDAFITHNRFFNNDTGVKNAIEVADGETVPTIDALDNWWSCNEGPNDAAGDCDTTTGPVDTTTWLKLTLTADKAHVLTGSPANLLATLTINSADVDVSGTPGFPVGKSVLFATTFGEVTPVEPDLVDGSASSVLTVGPWANYETATVSVALDNEIVTLDLLAGLRHFWMPITHVN